MIQVDGHRYAIGESETLLIFDPAVNGERVDFRFAFPQGDAPSVRTFYVEYPGVDLGAIPLAVHYNTAVGLILNAVPEGRHVTVVTESAVPRRLAEFWSRYHESQVSFAALIDADVPGAREAEVPGRIGVTFGGGKDSAFALSLLSRVSGPEKVLAISFTHPASHVTVAKLRRRRARQVLGSIERLGAGGVVEVLTDIRAVISGYHTELYFAPLGVLAYLGVVDALTVSYEFTEYFVEEDGRSHFRRSHPSVLGAMSRYYSWLTGRDFSVFNTNRGLTELSSFGFLASAAPGVIDEILMCEATAEPETRWCLSCTKCAEFVLYSALYRHPNTQIDTNRFFIDSPWVKRVLKEIGGKCSRDGGYLVGASSPRHVESFAYAVSRLTPKDLGLVDEAAVQGFQSVKEYCRGMSTIDPSGFYPGIIQSDYPASLRASATEILEGHLRAIEIPTELRVGNDLRVVAGQELSENLAPEELQHPAPWRVAFELFGGRQKFGSDQSGVPLEIDVSGLGSTSQDDLAVVCYPDSVSVSLRTSAPRAGDGYVIAVRARSGTSWASLELMFPRLTDKMRSRVRIELWVDGIEANTGDWPDASHSTLSIAPDVDSLELRVLARRDLEAWNWGRAMTTVLEKGRTARFVRDRREAVLYGGQVILESRDLSAKPRSN